MTSTSQGKAFGQQQSNFFQYKEDNPWCFKLTLKKFLKDLFFHFMALLASGNLS